MFVRGILVRVYPIDTQIHSLQQGFVIAGGTSPNDKKQESCEKCRLFDTFCRSLNQWEGLRESSIRYTNECFKKPFGEWIAYTYGSPTFQPPSISTSSTLETAHSALTPKLAHFRQNQNVWNQPLISHSLFLNILHFFFLYFLLTKVIRFTCFRWFFDVRAIILPR